VQNEDLGAVLLNKAPDGYVETSLEFIQGIAAFEVNQELKEVERKLFKTMNYLVGHYPSERKCNEKLYEADRNICLKRIPETKDLIEHAIDQWNKVGTGLTRLCNLGRGPKTLEDLFDNTSGTLSLDEDLGTLHEMEK
jgi:hypothetical protein